MSTTKSGGMKTLPGIKVNKAIVSIHNAIDEIEKLKKKRKALADQLADVKKTLAGNMRRAKGKLQKLPKGGLAYKFAGYSAVLHWNEKLDTKIGQES